MAYVRDVMRRDAVLIKEKDNVQKISKLLTEHKISNAPVVNAANELLGIVSEKDIIKAMNVENFTQLTARDIMTKTVVTVKENDPLEYVAKIFTEKPYRKLPVLDGKKVIAIINRENIIENFMNNYY